MEYLKLLVDLAKAIAWPSAVFALGYMFRSDVRALFPRLTKAGPTGLEFDPARQLLAVTSKELKVLPGFPDRTPMITKVETDLHAELDIIDPDKRIDLLVRHLAVARLDEVKAKYADFYEKNTFDEWIRYPVSAGLIEAKNDEVAITDFGREFLIYMNALGLSENTRPY